MKKKLFFLLPLLLIGYISFGQSNCAIINKITASTVVCEGASITLEVTATSPDLSTITYEWYKNGTLIVGANSFQYTISTFSLTDASTYSAKVSNACTTKVTSNPIVLTLAKKPTINSTFTATSLCVGNNFNTSVSAISNFSDPLSYQWYNGAVKISNETNTSFNINNLQLANAGVYSVEVKNSCGTTLSGTLPLTVISKPTFSVQPSAGAYCLGTSKTIQATANGANLLNWVKDGVDIGNATSQVILSSIKTSDEGTYILNASNTCGVTSSSPAILSVTQPPVLSSITSSSSVYCIGTALSLTPVMQLSGTYSYAWQKAGTLISNASVLNFSSLSNSDAGVYNVVATNNCGSSVLSTSQQVTIVIASTPTITAIADQSLCEGTSQIISATVASNNGGNLTYTWTKNGTAFTNLSNTINFSSVTKTSAGAYAIVAANSCGSGNSAGFMVNIKQQPVIINQPASATTLCSSGALSLNVSASTNNTDVLTYQWYKDGSLISLATSSTYNINTVSTSDAGNYTVVVKNSCGFSVTSSTAVVTIAEKPLIITQPVSQSVCLGASTASFTVVADAKGGGLLTYQWLKSGQSISNATSATYTISAPTALDVSSNYSVIVSNSCGVSTNQSSIVSLVVNQSPTVIISADTTVACVNTGIINLSSITEGSSLSYIWKKGTTQVGTNASLQLTGITASTAGQYTLQVSNGCGVKTSNSITVTTATAPIITLDLVDAIFCTGTKANLTVIADTRSGGVPTYVWSGPGISINQNTNQYTLNNFVSSQNGSYAVTVTNTCGTISSRTANITVQTSLAISTQPTSVALCKGSSKTLSVGLSGNISGVTYSWMFNDVAIVGATTANYTINNLSTSSAGNYKVKITSTCDAIVSSGAMVSIYDSPVFNVSPIQQTVCESDRVSLTASVIGANNGSLSTINFVWRQNGIELTGNNITNTTSGSTLSFSSIAPINKGAYQLAAIDFCGNTQLSSTINLNVNIKPSFTISPVSVNVCVGQSATLKSLATNTDGSSLPITYQWNLNGVPLGAGNANVYSIPAMSDAIQGVYAVVATNQCGSTSSLATINNISLPNLLTVSPDIALCKANSQTTSLKVTASTTNGDMPTVVWSTDVGSIIGTNLGNTIQIAATASAAKYTYTISNACGVYKDAQNNLPFINVGSEHVSPVVSNYTKPPYTTFCQYSSMNLTVSTLTTAADFERYTWKLNGVVVQNPDYINSSTYNNKSLDLTAAGNYTVDISNACGILNTAATIPVTINPKPVVSVLVNSSVSQCLSGNDFIFKNNTINTGGTLRYEWDFSDGSFDKNSITTASHIYAATGKQTVKLTATNDYGCSGVSSVTVYVQATPAITLQPIGATICSGTNYKLVANVDNSYANSLNYQWYNGTKPVTGANALSYEIPSMSASDAGSYTLHIVNSGCNYDVSSAVAIVNYQETPQANFTYDANATTVCLNNAIFNFKNTTPALLSGTASYIWTYSDGTIETGFNSNHQFLQVGIYSVSLQAISAGCSSTIKKLENIIVNGLPLITSDLANAIKVKKGSPLSLSVTASSNMGDGTSSNLTYKWYQTPNLIAGATNANYNGINAMSTSTIGDYYVEVSNGCGVAKSNVEQVRMVDVPNILIQPFDKQICVGKSVNLSVSSTSDDGTNPLYQWYYQSSPSLPQQMIPGAISNNYSIQKFSADSVGYYYVKITNSIGNVNSKVVYISDETIPQINSLTTMPAINGNVCVNTNLQFIAQAQSKRNTDLTISWLQNSVIINQQNSLQLNLNNLSVSNTGSYILQVSNACGIVSDTMALTVIDKPRFSKSIDPITKCVGTTASFEASVTQTTNSLPLNFQWIKDGIDYSGSGVTNNNLISVSNVQLSDSGQYALKISNSCGVSISNAAKLLVVGAPTITQQPITVNSCVGNAVTLPFQATTADNIIQYAWYKNGVIIPSELTSQILFSKITSTDQGSYKAVATNGCNFSVTSNIVSVTVNDKIILKESISDKRICVGNNFVSDLSAILLGTDTHTTYQWQLNGINLVNSSAQTSILQLPNINKVYAGNFTLQASNNCGTSNLALFSLQVSDKPTIVAHPVSATVCEGSDFSNSISVTNPDQLPFTYQWNKGGNAINGAVGPQFNIVKAAIADQGMYSVTLTNTCGVLNSDIGNFTVRSKPYAQIQMLSPTVQCVAGNNFNFKASVILSDNSSPFVYWDLGDGVSGNTNQMNHTYAISNNYLVYLYSKSIYGCTDTTSQSIFVNTTPLVLSQPNDQSICAAGTANFSLKAKLKSNEQIGYQWYYNDQLLIGETNASYNIPTVKANSAGFYKALIQNACGTIYTRAAELKVADKPLITIPLPITAKVCDKTTYSLKPIIFSILPNTYQWYKDNLPIVGQTLDSLLFPSFSSLNNGKYQVAISNTCGTTNSSFSNLLMRNIPSSIQQINLDTICYLSTTLLQHSPLNLINNDDTVFYNWKINGVMSIGNISNKFSIPKFSLKDTGLYTINLINSCGAIEIPIAKLTLNQPRSVFKVDTIGACTGKLLTVLTDGSNNLFPVKNYYWHIVEGNTTLADAVSVSNQFVNPGRYHLQHSIIDTKGCASDTVLNMVTNYGKPKAAFTVKDTCYTNQTIPINYSLLGFGSTKMLNYKWDFGEAVINNTNAFPNSYLYQSPGKKTITLIVNSDSSCVSDTMVNTIMVYGKPQAAFVTQDSCAGFPVLFTNKSSSAYTPDSIGTYIWNFGDSSLSVLKNPQHIYTQYGSYKIKLTATSASCPFLFTDTIVNFGVMLPREDKVYPIIHSVKMVPMQISAMNGGRSYNWQPYTGLTNSQIKDPYFSIKQDKLTYLIRIVDSAGCVLNDKQEVWAFAKPDIYLATAFSPNKDGINDYYQPEYVDIKFLEYFRISDKNNRQVYITNSMKDKWDGTANGLPLASDTYIVSVSGVDINGEKIIKQTLILLVK